MAYTSFVESLYNAAKSLKLAEMNKLLNAATPDDWKAAGTDISRVLNEITRKDFPDAHQSLFAQIIVTKGTVDGESLGYALRTFIEQGNHSAAVNTLNAMSAEELKAVRSHDYGRALVELTNPDHPDVRQVGLAHLIVTKGEVTGEDLGYALRTFIEQHNFGAATVILNAMSAEEIKSVSSNDYGRALVELTNPENPDSNQAGLAKLIVTKGAVDGEDLGYALRTFIEQGNFAAASHILTSMSAEEIKSVSSNDYGRALVELTNPVNPDVNQASLTSLIVTKGVVGGEDLGYALKAFIEQGNFLAAVAILNGMSAEEIKSVSSNDYGRALVELTNPENPDANQVGLAHLIVTKGVVDGEDLGYALKAFIEQGNFSAASYVINGMSAEELKSVSGNDFGRALVELTNTNNPDVNQTALAHYIVTKGAVNGEDLGYALRSFIEQGNFQAAGVILNGMSAEEIKSISRGDYDRALIELTNTNNPDANQNALTGQLVFKGELSGESLGYALREFIIQGNFAAAATLLYNLSAEEIKAISSHDYGRALVELTKTDIPDVNQEGLAFLITLKGNVDGEDLGYALRTFVEQGNFKAATVMLNVMSAEELKSVSGNDYGRALVELTNPENPDADQAALARLIVLKGEVDSEHLNWALVEFAEQENYAATNTILAQMGAEEKAGLTERTFDKLDYAGFKAGNDSVTGTKDDDVLAGYNGNDILSGGLGNDTLYGGRGDDTLYSGDGNDRIFGGDGNDTINAVSRIHGEDHDFVDGGRGTDKLIFDFKFSEVVVDFGGGLDIDFLVRGVNGSVTEVRDVEQLQFADRSFTTEQLFSMINASQTDNIM